MRVHGWCTECRRPRLVETSGQQLASAAAGRMVPAGTCAECAREADVRRRVTQRYGHTWEADARIAAELAGLRVRAVDFDDGWYTVVLEDGRQIREPNPARLRARLARTPRRR